jgi:hypothetical protein
MSQNQEGQEYVCAGAQCRCDKGSVPSLLQVTSQQTVYLHGKLWATHLDKLFAPFGTCALKNNTPCVPALLLWENVHERVAIGPAEGQPLLDQSTIRCAVGGVVSILNTLQVATPAPPATPAQAEASRVSAQSLSPLLTMPDDDNDDDLSPNSN